MRKWRVTRATGTSGRSNPIDPIGFDQISWFELFPRETTRVSRANEAS